MRWHRLQRVSCHKSSAAYYFIASARTAVAPIRKQLTRIRSRRNRSRRCKWTTTSSWPRENIQGTEGRRGCTGQTPSQRQYCDNALSYAGANGKKGVQSHLLLPPPPPRSFKLHSPSGLSGWKLFRRRVSTLWQYHHSRQGFHVRKGGRAGKGDKRKLTTVRRS